MSALQRLWLYKIKGQMRNLFSKKSSAIFTILIVLFYGFIFVSMFFIDKTIISAATMFDLHTTILMSLAMSALMVFIVLFQKRKALFFAEDSYYLFSGPFSRKQVMKYLISQTILQSFLYGLLSLFIMVCLGSNLALSAWFYILVVLVNAVISFFFLMLTDYLYILSITDAKYKILSRVIACSIIVFCVLIFLISAIQNGFNLNTSLIEFVKSELFYIIPLFGWAKLILVAFVEANYLMVLLGTALISLATAIVYYFFIHFKGDFYEQALEDSIAYTELYKQAKQGKSVSFSEQKVKSVNADFRQGAGALFSKSMITLRKTNGIFNSKELMVLVIYLVITFFTDLGISFFMYMLLFYLASLLQESDLSQELRNYQIYLIPEKPIKKLIAIILPTLYKTIILVSFAMIVAGFVFSTHWKEVLMYLVMIYGYVMVFISASVLSIQILKSRTNILLENMMRMLVILVSALPGLALTIYLFMNPEIFSMEILYIISYSSLVLNFVVSIFIIWLCRNLLNGREINSD